MRFVWAVAAFVLAALMIATGIAQRTVFAGPKSETTAFHTTGTAPYTLIDGAVLGTHPGTQTLRASANGAIFASYGRSADVAAWLAGTPYNRITLGKDGRVQTQTVAADGTVAGGSEPSTSPSPSISSSPSPSVSSSPSPASSSSPTPAATTAPAATEHHDPAGSDLWLDEFHQDDLLIQPLQLPASMSVLVATDGTQPAPAEISVTWPLNAATPWSGPLIVLGGILMAVGVFLYILAIRHVRRSRGPRRKSLPPLPETEPIDISESESEKGVISAGEAPASRRQSRRGMIAVPVVAVSALLFTGCTADAWPQFGGSPTPSPTETIVNDGQQAPAVTVPQADRILARISQTVTTADAKLDAKAAATRLAGAAYEERATNYTLRSKLKGVSALAPIPAKGLAEGVVLPQAYDGWPRTIMLVTSDKQAKNATSTIMMLTQQDAWANYKVNYIGTLEASTVMPDLAPAYVGAAAVPPDSSFLVMPPDQLAAAYADLLNKGDKSQYASAFDEQSDLFRPSVVKSQQDRLAKFNETGSKTASMTFSTAAGTDAPLSLATLESGAIVAVDVVESEIVKPTADGAVIKLNGNALVQALTGVDQSASGVNTSYVDQLFFYVPGQGSSDTKIRLLGYQSNILGAKVIK